MQTAYLLSFHIIAKVQKFGSTRNMEKKPGWLILNEYLNINPMMNVHKLWYKTIQVHSTYIRPTIQRPK